jgi:hypothetical protein
MSYLLQLNIRISITKNRKKRALFKKFLTFVDSVSLVKAISATFTEACFHIKKALAAKLQALTFFTI